MTNPAQIAATCMPETRRALRRLRLAWLNYREITLRRKWHRALAKYQTALKAMEEQTDGE